MASTSLKTRENAITVKELLKSSMVPSPISFYCQMGEEAEKLSDFSLN